jgi:DNA-binding response OmpR family regulator
MVTQRPSFLIVDDEQAICNLLCDVITEQGYACEAVNSASEALAVLKERSFDVALLDIKMPGLSGMELLEIIRRTYPTISAVMTTAVSDANTAVEAMKNGASDYIVKPFTVDEIRNRVDAVLKRSTLGPCGIYNGEKQNNPFWGQLDAIARGVEEHVDRFDFHRKVVTEQTIEVARHLGLPEKEVYEWAANRQEYSFVRNQRMEWLVQPKSNDCESNKDIPSPGEPGKELQK